MLRPCCAHAAPAARRLACDGVHVLLRQPIPLPPTRLRPPATTYTQELYKILDGAGPGTPEVRYIDLCVRDDAPW